MEDWEVAVSREWESGTERKSQISYVPLQALSRLTFSTITLVKLQIK